MEQLLKNIETIVGKDNVTIIDGSTGKEITMDHLISRLNMTEDDLKSETRKVSEIAEKEKEQATYMSFAYRAARELRSCISRLDQSRETSLAITKLDECMLWLKSIKKD